MSADTIGGVSGYIVDVVGTATHYVPASALLAADVVQLEAGKAAQASVAGYADVLVGGDKLAGDSTGLGDGTYKLQVSVDSGALTEIDVTIAAGNNLFSDLLTAIDTGLTNASLAASSSIAGGNVRITSDAVDNSSKIVVAEGSSAGLVAALAAALVITVTLSVPVDGNVRTWLSGQTVARLGTNALTYFVNAIVVYDTKGVKELLDGDTLLADVSGSFVQGELQAVVDKVNAIQRLLNSSHLV